MLEKDQKRKQFSTAMRLSVVAIAITVSVVGPLRLKIHV
jgi:hypothetical protein